jgi:polyisoprenyl-phosphate glycosyltransferase
MRCDSFRLSVVIPAFNEAENIPLLVEKIDLAVGSTCDFEIIIVDDGSNDDSAAVLQRCILTQPRLKFVLLSRNYGHQVALRAGLEQAIGDCVICLDADLQHPPELLGRMIAQWQAGADVVSCLRREQKDLPFMKRITSKWFYRIISWISGISLAPGSSDFRLIDRKVARILNELPESDLFYRGLIPTLGFRSETIEYAPNARQHGQSKYDLRKMVKLALTGVISTSTRPLRTATYFALATAVGALSFLTYVLYIFFIDRSGVPGWASTLAVMLIIGTMQLLVLGVIGEYLGQVLKEVRRRPPYIVNTVGGETSMNHEQSVRNLHAA